MTASNAGDRNARDSAVLATILALALLGVGAKLEVLGPLDRFHALGLALGALEFQHDLLRGFCLLVEHRLRLPAKAFLFFLVTTIALSLPGLLARLVLGDLVRCMFLARNAVTSGSRCSWSSGC